MLPRGQRKPNIALLLRCVENVLYIYHIICLKDVTLSFLCNLNIFIMYQYDLYTWKKG